MGKIFFTSFLLFFALGFTPALAQESPKEKGIGTNTPETLFDFWVGSWEATWDEGDGSIGKGVNEIVKILDQKVLQERFRITAGQNKGFKGTSISVYQPSNGNWKQAWADNQGGYFNFTAVIEGDKKIFKTQPMKVQGKTVISRMVFMDIKVNSFTWDWESSYDGGDTWKLNWRIAYKRI